MYYCFWVFWIKNYKSKLIHSHVEKKIGKTILIDGDDFRQILKQKIRIFVRR